MGAGWIYKCKNCGKDYEIFLGFGFMGYKERDKFQKEVIAGKYGEELKEKLEKDEIYLSFGDSLFVCEKCGKWYVKPSRRIYEKVQEEETDEFEDEDNLEESPKPIFEVKHKCRNCNCYMKEIDDNEMSDLVPLIPEMQKEENLSKLNCPKCGTKNFPNPLIMRWD